MAVDDVIVRAGTAAVPLDYKVPTGTEIVPKVVTATLNGAGAAGPFLAVLEIISPSGVVTAYCLRQLQIAAGASATVSWFPGGGLDDTATVDVDTSSGVSELSSTGGTITVSSPSGPIANVDLPATGATPGTYGDSTHTSQVAVDAEGRITGVSSVAISGSGGAGGLIVLYDSGYLGADTATLDTGAGGIASGHFCIVVFAYLRSTAAANNDNVVLTLNNDNSALYDVNRMQTNNGGIAGAVVVSGTTANAGDAPAANAGAGAFATWELVMPAYDGTSNFKQAVCRTGMAVAVAANSIGDVTSVGYRSTSAISRLKIAPSTVGANWKAGSRLIVYGTQ